MLTERLNFSGEAVWLAYASLSGKDNHWLRPDINPLLEDGHGSKGYQLESTLSYALTKRWLLVAQGRGRRAVPDTRRAEITIDIQILALHRFPSGFISLRPRDGWGTRQTLMYSRGRTTVFS